MGGQQPQQLLHIALALDGIDVQACNGQVGRQVLVLGQVAKIGGQQELDLASLEVVVGGVERMLPVGIQLGHQNRLVDLHPFHALRGQHVQQLGIDG
ncbi:hypothetical protein D3C72_1916350 [compost metagenome]